MDYNSSPFIILTHFLIFNGYFLSYISPIKRFAETATGLSPDTVMFNEKKEILKDMSLDKSNYHLRPEIVETFFILNQLTGDPVYREWGWEIFMSIEKFCKTKYGYGSYANVTDVNLEPKDQMESYFLAETLKYLYLLMDPDTEVDVLNKVIKFIPCSINLIFSVYNLEVRSIIVLLINPPAFFSPLPSIIFHHPPLFI